MPANPFDTLQTFTWGAQRTGTLHALPRLEAAGVGPVSRLPVSVRVILESLLRRFDGTRVTERHVRELANWQPGAARSDEIPFFVARVLLQDFTGIPLLADLAAMRSAAQRLGRDPRIVEPLVPVDLVVDHSVQVDHYNSADALRLNMELEFARNAERYRLIKWGMQAFDTFRVIPSGIGIVHQVNLEYLARGVAADGGLHYPDTLVGTDSHTTMVNGMGILGWGVGGIEAEAAMLGQPVYLLTPDVVGVHLAGRVKEGVTATDLVLTLTELLRKAKVVGKFVEFFGEGAEALAVPDRCTIGNMAPEYGATAGFFPPDESTARFMRATGRSEEAVDRLRAYYTAQGLYGMPRAGAIDYSQVLQLDLASVVPSVAGPRRPQDRIELPSLRLAFERSFSAPASENGYAKPPDDIECRFATRLGMRGSAFAAPLVGGGRQTPESAPPPEAKGDGTGLTSGKNTSLTTELEMMDNRPTPDVVAALPAEEQMDGTVDLCHGDVLIAAITSCTNTSNPAVMLAAGLLARKAVQRGLSVSPWVKTSLAPGSRVVTEYLKGAGLQHALDALGFKLVGYGCTTCIGNSGPLDPHLEEAIVQHDLVCAAVLSGNRNFEARIHQAIKANFLMSPPLVVAFAIAGTVRIDLSREPLGKGSDGLPVYLRDVWPTQDEIAALMNHALDPATYRRLYGDFARANPLWDEIPTTRGALFGWEPSTYIHEPPFFAGFGLAPAPHPPVRDARALAIFGDSVTTDHISPAGAIKPDSPAGRYLRECGVPVMDFNSYGARRGNHEVMLRGTFANVRIRNLMLPGSAGSVTRFQPGGEEMTIYDAAMRYRSRGVPTVVFAGEEYGTGSSRDWAAKGTQLLGVRAVIARSFERIHRSNLVGMGVLPLQFEGGDSAATLGITGEELFDLEAIEDPPRPRQRVTLRIRPPGGEERRVPLVLRVDTPTEADYYVHGGILPYVLRALLQAPAAA